MNIKTNVSDKESDVHSQEHFPEQTACISADIKHRFERTVLTVWHGKRRISESGFIFFYADRNDAIINSPTAECKPRIIIFSDSIGNKDQRVCIKLGVLNRKPEFLFIKWKITNAPSVFHDALHLH